MIFGKKTAPEQRRFLRKGRDLAFLILLCHTPFFALGYAQFPGIDRPGALSSGRGFGFTIRDTPTSGTAKLYRVDREKIKGSREIRVANLLPARVVSVVDGDTVKVQIDEPRPSALKSRETIRLLGIDAPESRPPRPKGYFGQESSAYVKGALTGRRVYLAFDWDLRDVYGRLLAYIYVADGDCFNLDLVRLGYAYAYIKYRFAFMDEFTQTEETARKEKLGLWAQLPPKNP